MFSGRYIQDAKYPPFCGIYIPSKEEKRLREAQTEHALPAENQGGGRRTRADPRLGVAGGPTAGHRALPKVHPSDQTNEPPGARERDRGQGCDHCFIIIYDSHNLYGMPLGLPLRAQS
jgi:hypothetical protein